MNIPGFKLLNWKNRGKNKKTGNAPGGVAIFIKESIADLFELVSMGNEDTIWVKAKKEVTGEERDIYIRTCYFNPAQTKQKL